MSGGSSVSMVSVICLLKLLILVIALSLSPAAMMFLT